MRRAAAAGVLGALLLTGTGCGGTSTVAGSAQPSAAQPGAAQQTGSGSSSPSNTPRVVLRFRPVLQTEPAAGAATEDSAGATAVPGTPVSQEQAAAAYAALRCTPPPSPRDEPADYTATCSTDGSARYLLGPAVVDGAHVSGAQARLQEQTGSWVVEVALDAATRDTWARYTAAHVGDQVAVTVDGRVFSAPVIQGAIDGPTQISGNFSETSARRLAQQLGGG